MLILSSFVISLIRTVFKFPVVHILFIHGLSVFPWGIKTAFCLVMHLKLICHLQIAFLHVLNSGSSFLIVSMVSPSVFVLSSSTISINNFVKAIVSFLVMTFKTLELVLKIVCQRFHRCSFRIDLKELVIHGARKRYRIREYLYAFIWGIA